MKKIKFYFLSIITFLLILFSCDEPNLAIENPFEDADYEMLAKNDDESIVKFLSTHYYNDNLDDFSIIENGETSLLNSNNLKTQNITITLDDIEIDYKLYTYVIEEGGNTSKGKPTNIDSLLLSFSSRILIPETITEIDGVDSSVGNVLNASIIESEPFSWNPANIIGRGYGLTNFNPGINTTKEGERVSFENTGEGYIFIPGGLAYPSTNFVPRTFQEAANPDPRFDAIIVSKIEFFDFVRDTDHDNDGIPSILESPDCDKNPRNDFNDKFFPGLADYLNPNIAESFDCNK